MRYKELDGLRGLAALSVYFSHLLGIISFKPIFFQILSNSPIHLIWHGESAVTLFFLLSGFVLTLPFLKNKDTVKIFPFYIKRIFRIYPVFLLAILFSIILKSLFFQLDKMLIYSSWINQFWKWNIHDISISTFFKTFILIGYTFDTKLFIPIIGTLRTEMIISLIMPFLIYIAFKLKIFFNIIVLVLLFTIRKDIVGVFYIGILIALYKDRLTDFLKNRSSFPFQFCFLFIASILYTARF
jgi:peptidoglycan/LPS O-acetylase OafA/YrhL